MRHTNGECVVHLALAREIEVGASFEDHHVVDRDPRLGTFVRGVDRRIDRRVHRHDRVAHHRREEAVLRERGRDQAMLDRRQERHRMARIAEHGAARARAILVAEIGVAEILDAGASELRELGQELHRRIGDRAEHPRERSSRPLERRPTMRGAEIDDAPSAREPPMPALAREVTRAPHDQTAHAVAEKDELADRDRIVVDQRLDEAGEGRTVLGDREARVEADVERGEAQVAREQRSVVGTVVHRPDGLGAHEPVNEHHYPIARRDHCPDRLAIEHSPALDEGHLGRERVLAAGEIVADGSVQDRDRELQLLCHSPTLGRGRRTSTPAGPA
jgi:hypothetical protein